MNQQPAPRAFHVMAKPTGARCNLRCDYCFFLEKAGLYPGSDFRMSEAVMERYIRQTIAAHTVPQVALAWQGGEPTLMGLPFFRRAVEVAERWRKPGMTIEHVIQTNGVLLDEEWCRFLRENNFLVGLSVDGPKNLHDAYRHDARGGSVFNSVVRAARLLKVHRVEFNILCTVNAVNSLHPLEVYRFFRDELGAQFIQFIPIVERAGGGFTDRSVDPEQFGRFLIAIFDEWVRRDVGRTFVLTFDGVLASWLRGQSTLCVFRPTCGEGVALEHNGDVYSCDHFVDPAHLLGNINDTSLGKLVGSTQQREFGHQKANLPPTCRECPYLFACHGECPKNRLSDGQNYLCPGLKAFFQHTEPAMKIMADLLRRGLPADGVMK